jgi:hypothetical protein
MRSFYLGKPEVPLCGYCGVRVNNLSRGNKKFCSADCYHQKQRSQPLEQRFWSKVDRSGECWLWTDCTYEFGYGQFSFTGEDGKRKTVGAHRMAYELTHGPLNDGQWVLHHCDVPNCVRPDHLFIGDHKANMEDAQIKGRLHTPRPKKQKLTVAQVYEVRRLVASGEKQIRVAERFGISETQVSLLMQGKRRQYDAPLVPLSVEKAS